MSAKHVIFSTKLTGYRPVIWGATTVHSQYLRLRSVLRDQLGEPFAHLLAEPVIPGFGDPVNSEAQWLSEIMTSSEALSNIPESGQGLLRDQLNQQLQAVRSLGDRLKASVNPDERSLGGLLNLAIEVPAPSCIRVQQNRLTLVMWGFSSDQRQTNAFRISQYLEAKPTPLLAASIPMEQVTEKTELPPKPIEPEKVQGIPWYKRYRWLLYGLLFLLLLILLIWLLRDCSYNRSSALQPSERPSTPATGILPEDGRAAPYLPERPGTIVDPAPEQIITDPNDPLHQKVIGNRLIAFLKDGVNPDDFAARMKTEFPTNDWQFISYDSTYNIVELEFLPAQRETWRSRLEEQPEVLVVIDDRILSTSSTPTDPDFAKKAKSWHLGAIHAPQAWNTTLGKPEVVIAVIDAGCDPGHPELKDRIAGTWNVLTHESTIQTGGDRGSLHGTHVAATAAGAANNGVGSSGVAPGCKIMPVKVGNNDGTMSLLAIIYGIQYAIVHKAAVINLSLGMKLDSATASAVRAMTAAQQKKLRQSVLNTPSKLAEKKVFERIFAEANRQNIVIVIAAGNDDIPVGFDPIENTPYTINVSANSSPTVRAPFSNYGALVTVSAPGDKIYSAAPNGGEAVLSGTSMAAPMVSGAVALIKSVRNDLSPLQIRDILVKTALPVATVGGKASGPFIQIDKALNASKSWSIDKNQSRIDSLQREIDILKKQKIKNP